ncbi:toll/interleukin-1 receptor domain-containing protein [Actinomadura sp. 7K534]|uniref:toll/interleukin-1 receptor domain-containing protein n=1 Tax=Actinomadura sp. 7K534 TaxID=2530366 RepID=UPI001404E05D|nr:toll/interleukin-1 receptor domain-containing protein [Actinomadura sp. 7K534]
MSGVFINYRSVDQPIAAESIYVTLKRQFGEKQVFLDHINMKAGDDYPTELREALERVDVLVVVIGPDWLSLEDERTGERLIDRERDWVRREIRRALERGIEIVPVLLVDLPKPTMPPDPDKLPAEIRGLGVKQVHRISKFGFENDLNLLVKRVTHLSPELGLAELFVPPPQGRRARQRPQRPAPARI